MDEIKKIIEEIQDYLVPHLDTYEQAIYHYIFRHTFLVGEKNTYYRTRTAEIGYGQGNKDSKPSDRQRSIKLRSLESKGAIKILERSNKGILVQIFLPHEIQGLIKEEIESEVNISLLDFYKDRRLLPSIIDREGYRCFYMGKKIMEGTCYLDHVIPLSAGGDNSYKNIVACCYDANSMKSDKPVEEFLRILYKEDLLNLQEFNAVKAKLGALKDGKLVPKKEKVIDCIHS